MAERINGRWAPGQSANPAGRPKKGFTVTDLMSKTMDRKRFVDVLLQLAYGGDIRAIELVLRYIDGPPTGPKVLANADDRPQILIYIPENHRQSFIEQRDEHIQKLEEGSRKQNQRVLIDVTPRIGDQS